LVDGRLREITLPDALASWVAAAIVSVVRAFVERHRLGWVFNSDVGIDIVDELNHRRADGCFVSFVDLPRLKPGPLRVVPDASRGSLLPMRLTPDGR
jgi:hypothetical protein